ncbi:MAG: hypothetical protein DIU62_001230 [Pseudomonadota bacterium]|jgi:predicted nucleotidyltransferase|nr:MAG: hypothetical protein DIU62_01325 [Pseudomonadota bacterium]
MRPRPGSIAILGLAMAGLLAGCAGLTSPRERGPADALPTTEAIQAAQVNSLLSALARVVAGTPTEQAEIMAEARMAYEQARQGPAALRYGLLLAAPSHPARDPSEALHVLRECLAHAELLSTMERALAQVELERITVELRLTDENQRLLAESQQARDRQRGETNAAALARQLQAAQEQNAQLRRALEDARAKLNAIAEFERPQNDRPPASNEGRNP